MTKLSSSDAKLYRAVDEVLHYIWDPIGVAGEPMARDEYSSILPQVFRLLKEDANPDEIADYLSTITAEHMGINGEQPRNLSVAKVLLEWKVTIRGEHP